jgi:hypothetical protein
MKVSELTRVVVIVGAITGSSAAAQDFPLVCRGGPTMRFKANKGNDQGTFNILGLFFAKGTQPSGRGLAPGQCSWLDRGMNTAEPSILQQNVAAGVRHAPWFDELKSPANSWTFYVHFDPAGVFMVSSARSNRPPPPSHIID